MRRLRLIQAAGMMAVAVAACAGAAQQPAASPPPAIEPAAMAALQSMGAYLRGLKSFQVQAVTTDEEVLEDGQKLLYAGTTTILVKAPDRLWAEVANDRREREFYYDGKTFTLFARGPNLYATVPAPPTIRELIETLEDKRGFSLPLVDLFRWGGADWSAEAITSGREVGVASVDGTTCGHYAFRTEDVDWQVWVQRGEHPLPRKLVITTRTDDERPQHTAVYTWNLAPAFNDAAFAFDPPEGAGKVALTEAAPAPGTER